MKALTGLSTPAYLRVAEEAKIPLADLLQLVQALEGGASPGYLARYRPEVSAGLDGRGILDVEARLRQLVDLEERRVTVLTALGQRDCLTPELKSEVESALDRQELEELYRPYSARRRTRADEAAEKGLEPLAALLLDEQPDGEALEKAAKSHVRPDQGIETPRQALEGARQIAAQRIADDPALRSKIRNDSLRAVRLTAHRGRRAPKKESDKKRFETLRNFSELAEKVAWRQLLAMKRGTREEWLRYEVTLPENQIVSNALQSVVKQKTAESCLHLGAAARIAYNEYIRPSLLNEATHLLDSRCESEALAHYRRNLRKLLMMPPAGPMTVIGLEVGRPGGWRAAVVNGDGEFVAGGILEGTGERSEAKAKLQARVAAKSNGHETVSPEPVNSGSPPAPGQDGEGGSSASSEASLPQGQSGAGGPEASKSAEGASSGKPAPTGASTEAAQGESAAAAEASKPGAEDGGAGAATNQNPPPSTQGGSPDSAAENTSVSGADHPSPGSPTSSPELKEPSVRLSELISTHQPQAIVFAAGPSTRAVERFIRQAVREAGAPQLFWTGLQDAGTWIYATSKAAKQELPETGVAVRSAVSLARRLQDPMYEMLKLEPRLLGIGQLYQEVEPRKLRAALRAEAEACVCEVGVDVNRASAALLAYTPGFTDRLAKRVAEYRTEHGKFSTRSQLREVAGLKNKIYETAAGFLRVHGAENPLEATGVHPDHYAVAERLAAAAGKSVSEALEDPGCFANLDLEELAQDGQPIELLRAILAELRPESHDPRGKYQPPRLPIALRPESEIQPGRKVEGIVTNVADFGAFVDIGAAQDGLVHVSQIPEEVAKDRSEMNVGDRVTVHILALEQDGKRISLTMRDPAEIKRAQEARRRTAGARKPDAKRRRKPASREAHLAQKTFGPDQKERSRKEKAESQLSMEEKLSLLKSRFRTKV